MGLRDDIVRYVKGKFVEKCMYRMKYGGYNDYMVSKWFGSRLLALIVVETLMFLILASKYGFNSEFINDLIPVFMVITLVYAIVSGIRYEIEEQELREKMEQMCSDIGSIAADISYEIIHGALIGSLEEALGKDYERIASLVRRKKELEDMLRDSSDRRNKKILRKYLKQADAELEEAILKAIGDMRMDVKIVKKLLERIL